MDNNITVNFNTRFISVQRDRERLVDKIVRNAGSGRGEPKRALRQQCARPCDSRGSLMLSFIAGVVGLPVRTGARSTRISGRRATGRGGRA